jgi:hypothetical protein
MKKLIKPIMICIMSCILLVGCGKREEDPRYLKMLAEAEKSQQIASALPSATPIFRKGDGTNITINRFVDTEHNNVCYIYDTKSISCLPLTKETK